MTNIKIKWGNSRATIPFIGVLVALCYYLFVQVIPKYKESFFEQKKVMLEELILSEWTTLNSYNELVKDSILTLEEAKSQYIKQLSKARFGSKMQNYFWVGDTNRNMIYHPYLSLNKIKEAIDTPSSPFDKSIEIALKQKEGFFEYEWYYKFDTTKKTAKLSYVKIYQPWGWIISTGLYYEDYEPLLKQSINKLLIPSIAVFLVIFLILGFIFNLWRMVVIDKSLKESILKDTETKYQKFLEESPIPTEVFDKDGNLIQVNKAWENFWMQDGKTTQDFNILKADVKKDSEVYKKIQQAYKGKSTNTPWIKVDPYIPGTGLNEKWVTIKIYPVYSCSSGISNVVVQYIDQTSVKQANDKLRKLSEAIKQSPSSIVITDKNGLIEYVNPKFEEITGYKQEEILNKNPNILNSGEMPDELFENLWKTISNGKVWRNELLNRKKNGELIWESTAIAPIFDKDNSISHYVAVKENITERKKMEKELITAKNKAEETDKLKSAFIANISHEIRTPLNAIVGFSSFLVEEKLDPETRKEFSEHIRINTDILTNLIDDIIDISLIEAGKIKIHKEDIRLIPILKEILTTYKDKNNRIDKKDVNFKLILNDIPEDYMVYTDANRLRQILNNLLSNALKYTNKGKITLECGCAESGFLLFKVEDTGIGIPKELQKRIFEKFTHVDQEYVSLHGGTGLGLSITRDLVILLGGKIWLKSSPGKYSTFSFTLPGSKKKDQKQKKIHKYYWPGRYILFAEDEETNYQYINALLKDSGVTIFRARNGKEAMEIMKKQPNIDLILMDIKMPDIDGYEASLKIRKDFPDIPILAQTAYSTEEQLEQFAKAKFTEYLIKPINKYQLLKTLNKYF